ncbi:MAG: histidine triad nucleotide-binding protein [Gammaproteobacteria bacterium]|nr:histidine triad nucleotide-binding protein [Gammaproteobacteria bacterium]MBT8134077.1 histidine triad nucleotide-binding protein [Gammaproteobacteria bacterium]NNJ50135.1 histidine triad nucleotide-binding protein [Gammaproteobacteria bacterium]
MSDCLFCKIREGVIPADIIFENDDVLAFNDVNPQAPVHLLIIPKKHISTVNDMVDDDQVIMGKLFSAARTIASQKGVSDDGYRLVVNCNEKAGQTVFHIHMHMLADRALTWPPG